MEPCICSAKITRVQLAPQPEEASGDEDNGEGEDAIEDSQILEDLPNDTEVSRRFLACIHRMANVKSNSSRRLNSSMLA